MQINKKHFFFSLKREKVNIWLFIGGSQLQHKKVICIFRPTQKSDFSLTHQRLIWLHWLSVNACGLNMESGYNPDTNHRKWPGVNRDTTDRFYTMWKYLYSRWPQLSVTLALLILGLFQYYFYTVQTVHVRIAYTSAIYILSLASLSYCVSSVISYIHKSNFQAFNALLTILAKDKF